MPSRWDAATCGWRRRVFHYPPPTLMSRNFRLPCAIELQPLSLTPLKMRKVEQRFGSRRHSRSHVGLGEIVALVKQGRSPRSGQRVGESITEIQAGRVVDATVGLIGAGGGVHLLLVQWDQCHEG